VEAGGIMSTAASGTLPLSPFYGTSSGVALGASGAQTVVASLTNIPWYLKFVVIFRTIGAAGANSGVTCSGMFQSAGAVGTAGSSIELSFGSNSTTAPSVHAE